MPPLPGTGRRRPTLAAILALALLLRLAVLGLDLLREPDHLEVGAPRIAAALERPEVPFVHPAGFEASNIARSLVCAGEGFASPFGGDTGPTGWISPGVVAAWSLAFALFGCFTPAALLAVRGIALAASLATVAAGYRVAGRLHGGGRAAAAGGLLLALSPWDLALYHGGHLLDLGLPSAAAAVLLALLLASARGGGRPAARDGAAALAVAAAALVSPVLAVAAAPPVAYLAWRRARRPPAEGGGTAGAARLLALFAAAQLLVVGPWLVHQRLALGHWSYVKSNAPFEIWLGNRPETGGVVTGEGFRRRHPSQSAEEYRAYRRLGEAAYVADRFERFQEGFDAGHFARATGRRALRLFLWHPAEPWEGPIQRWLERAVAAVPGVVLVVYPFWKRRRGGLDAGDAVLYLFVAGYAAPYLVTMVTDRYIGPVGTAVLVLAAGPVAGLFSGSSARRTQSSRGGIGDGPADDGPSRASPGSGRFS